MQVISTSGRRLALPTSSARVWTTAAIVVSAPLVAVLCFTLWRTPFPITEIVAVLEDLVERPTTYWLSPFTNYYRPLWYLAISGLWHNGAAVETRLDGIKLLTILPVVVLVPTLVLHLRPRTSVDAASAALSVAVLLGSAGFRENLETGLSQMVLGMPMALVVWILLNRERRAWTAPVIIALTLTAIGFKEHGLVLVPLALIGWWTGAPGASRAMAATSGIIGVAYIALRLSGGGTWNVFEQDVGLGFTEWDTSAAEDRFGSFPYWVYAYSGASTMANVLFAEPTRGIFRIVHAAIDNRLEPWHAIHLASSATLTGIIAWWGVHSVRKAMRSEWSLESRLFVSMVVVLLISGLLSFNYSRDRLGGMAVVFYAAAAFFAVRKAAEEISATGATVRFAAGALLLCLVATAWQIRAIANIEWARTQSSSNQEQWFGLLEARRIEFAHRPVYVRIMESMVEQGRDPGAPRPMRRSNAVHAILGP